MLQIAHYVKHIAAIAYDARATHVAYLEVERIYTAKKCYINLCKPNIRYVLRNLFIYLVYQALSQMFFQDMMKNNTGTLAGIHNVLLSPNESLCVRQSKRKKNAGTHCVKNEIDMHRKNFFRKSKDSVDNESRGNC